MKVETEQLPGSQVVLTIDVEDGELATSMDRAYRRVANRTNIPGFRKGKAPKTLVDRYIGRSVVLQDALEELIPQVYRKAIDEHKIDVIEEPDIEILQLEPVSFKATVAVRPKVELGDYKSLRLPLEVAPVTDEQVEQELERMRREAAPWEPVEHPAALGDLVTIDVHGTVDGQPMNQEGVQYRLMEGSTSPVPGFAEALVGMSSGEEREVSFDFPPDHPVMALAGKSFRYQVRCSEVKAPALPALDDEFAKGVGAGYESFEALRTHIREDLQKQAENMGRTALESKAVDALVEQMQVDLPDAMLKHETEHLIQDRLQVLQGSRVNLDSYLQESRKTEEELYEEMQPAARERVLRSLAMLQFAEDEGIAITDEDVAAEIEKQVAEMGEEDADRMRSFFANPELRESFARNLLTRRTLERLAGIVTQPKPVDLILPPSRPARRRRAAASESEQEQETPPEQESQPASAQSEPESTS